MGLMRQVKKVEQILLPQKEQEAMGISLMQRMPSKFKKNLLLEQIAQSPWGSPSSETQNPK